MGLFKREEMPSIGKEIGKLDEQDRQRNDADEARQIKEYENSPIGMAQRRIENAAKYVKVEKYTPEALEKAQQELQKAEQGLHDLLSDKTMLSDAAYGIQLSNSEFWHKKINVAQETIKQLEALRDGKPATEEVGKS